MTVQPDEGDVFELDLTVMAHGGSAIGRHEGRTIFVPYAIPGERITARITQDKGRFAYAEGVTLLDGSEWRVYPRCPHFGPGRCGGCQWQHIDYPAQLEFKRLVVADQMARIGGFQDVIVQPTIASPDPWQYRSHITFHITAKGQPGFIATDDQHTIPIEECHIIRPELLELFDSLDLESLQEANLSRVRLQIGTEAEDPLVILSTHDDEVPSVEIDLPVSVSFLSEDEVPQALIGTGCVHYRIKDRLFRVTAGSFFQVNLPQAETLVDLVLSGLDLQGHEQVLDLYSGVGLFSTFLAERASLLTTIEGYPPAVDDADFNLRDFENVSLIEGAVEGGLAQLEDSASFDAAVIDPPRVGMEPEALTALADLAPQKIVYVSCDPATLARDAKRLAARNYRLLSVQPVDMFPQTYHIETVALFAR
jgi:23S rRNA (uracil1939-C5)-methyltransferase